MPGSGTRTFLDPYHYEAGLRQTLIEAVITSGGAFKARLTWVELHHMQLLRCAEDHPHIAYLSLPPTLACISFAANSDQLPVWRGAELQAGDIMFHSLGERLHQSNPGH